MYKAIYGPGTDSKTKILFLNSRGEEPYVVPPSSFRWDCYPLSVCTRGLYVYNERSTFISFLLN